MTFIDWLEKNKESLLNTTGKDIYHVAYDEKWSSQTVYGLDFAPFIEEFEKLDEFKGIEMEFPTEPRVESFGKYYSMADVEVSSKNGWKAENWWEEDDRNFSFVFKPDQYKNETLYFYGVRVYKNKDVVGLRFSFVPDGKYLNKKKNRINRQND